jgi:hypothetical protein
MQRTHPLPRGGTDFMLPIVVLRVSTQLHHYRVYSVIQVWILLSLESATIFRRIPK